DHHALTFPVRSESAPQMDSESDSDFRRRVLIEAYGHKFPEELPPDLARAASAVHGLSTALEALKNAYPEKLQAVGFNDAHDLVECLVHGSHHPLLEFWTKIRRRPSLLPVERLNTLILRGLAEHLAKTLDESTKLPFG